MGKYRLLMYFSDGGFPVMCENGNDKFTLKEFERFEPSEKIPKLELYGVNGKKEYLLKTKELKK